MTKRPLILIPGRYAESTSVTRWAGVVNARALLELVFAAGGEPLTALPRATQWDDILGRVDGVLLPGGSDIDPALYGSPGHPEVYGVDGDQDSADLALARASLDTGVPLLAICRGFQVVNIARGGTLITHMNAPHRHTRQSIDVRGLEAYTGVTREHMEISCYHHQAIDQLGEGIVPLAWADDGTVEAAVCDSPGFAMGLQWHPEDNYDSEPGQLALVSSFIEHARARRG